MAVKSLQGSLLFVCPQLAARGRATAPPGSQLWPLTLAANKLKSSPPSMEHCHGFIHVLLLQNGLQTPLCTGRRAAAPFESSQCPQRIWSHDLEERSQKKKSELGASFQSDSCDLVSLLPIKDEQLLQQTSILPLWKSKQDVIFSSTNPSSLAMSWENMII